ncbi:hypothetical protein Tco_0703460 [Tanacetum coccineum]|uniref:Histone deacetylase 14 n=1 Tax=Tanacetum coccineum TaxID=301880 RepID=A0ABQ4XYZ2_9ASTR
MLRSLSSTSLYHDDIDDMTFKFMLCLVMVDSKNLLDRVSSQCEGIFLTRCIRFTMLASFITGNVSKQDKLSVSQSSRAVFLITLYSSPIIPKDFISNFGVSLVDPFRVLVVMLDLYLNLTTYGLQNLREIIGRRDPESEKSFMNRVGINRTTFCESSGYQEVGVHHYHALGACLDHSNAFLRRLNFVRMIMVNNHWMFTLRTSTPSKLPNPGNWCKWTSSKINSNEEPVLGYLKFSAKGTKREVFGMPILNDLIIDDIRGEQYYIDYMEKVAKHQRYLAGEEVSDPDTHAPKPAKATKPKAPKQSKPLAPKAATKKPKPGPAKT